MTATRAARPLRIANERAAQVWAKVGEELDADDEDLQMLRVAASRRHGHATGLWAPGHAMPAEGKADWFVLAGFETSPYDVDEQGPDYLFGDVRMYVMAPGDILAPARGLLGADLPIIGFAVYRLRANGGFTMDPMPEESLVEALAEECRRVMAAVGAGGGGGSDDEGDGNDRECSECHADTRAWTDPDPGNDEADKQLAVPKFCGNCGREIPIEVKAEVVES